MKELQNLMMISNKNVNKLYHFGFKDIYIADNKYIAYEFDNDTYLAFRKVKDKYIMEYLQVNPDLFVGKDSKYTAYYLPNILINLIKSGIIKKCSIDYD